MFAFSDDKRNVTFYRIFKSTLTSLPLKWWNRISPVLLFSTSHLKKGAFPPWTCWTRLVVESSDKPFIVASSMNANQCGHAWIWMSIEKLGAVKSMTRGPLEMEPIRKNRVPAEPRQRVGLIFGNCFSSWQTFNGGTCFCHLVFTTEAMMQCARKILASIISTFWMRVFK